MKPVILLGSGGHAKVLLGMLNRLAVPIIGVADPNQPPASIWFGLKVLGGDASVLEFASNQVELVNGLGSLPGDSGVRLALYKYFSQQGYVFKTVIDPRAFVAEGVFFADGVQVMAGAIIQVGTKFASNSIVNSGAIVEHDCRIGKHVHIAPGATLSGQVQLGDKVHIGTGATIIQGMTIGDESVVGAGSVITKPVGRRQIVFPPRAQYQDL
jgi:UDP-perosamine 4-acetyltransferase